MYNKFKIFITVLSVIFMITVSGCSKPDYNIVDETDNHTNIETENDPEAAFNEAMTYLDNYTVQMKMKSAGISTAITSTFEIAGDKGKLVYRYDNRKDEYITYYREIFDMVYHYEIYPYDISETTEVWKAIDYSDYKSMEDVTEDFVGGFLYIFHSLIYDDFEQNGNEFKLKENALEAYEPNSSLTVNSLRIKIEKNHFTAAVFVISTIEERIEIRYNFFNYGSTKIELPT